MISALYLGLIYTKSYELGASVSFLFAFKRIVNLNISYT